jgi:hypothetical protein
MVGVAAAILAAISAAMMKEHALRTAEGPAEVAGPAVTGTSGLAGAAD